MYISKDTLESNIKKHYLNGKNANLPIDVILTNIYSSIDLQQNTVDDKVTLSKIILSLLSHEDRKHLIMKLLQEQVVDQRKKLSFWSATTSQSSQIDTGYIAQHLISLITKIPGQGMRGKGNDLIDGSEIKAANFLDSLDKRGAVSPRWNFTAVEVYVMERFLDYTNIYLVSLDLNPENRFRIRAWLVDITKHTQLRNRYHEWMQKLGYPKFNSTTSRPSVNFQLFPPKNKTNDNFARHGNGRDFEKLQIQLENVEGASLIFLAEENTNGDIEILKMYNFDTQK